MYKKFDETSEENQHMKLEYVENFGEIRKENFDYQHWFTYVNIMNCQFTNISIIMFLFYVK